MFKKTRVCQGVLIALGSAMLLPAMAQTPSAERIEITGSRIKSLAAEGASPVAVLGSADIKIDGVRNVESLLNNLPQVFADQGGNVVNGSTGTAAVNLRGLGSSRTLVLMNGRRLPMGSANTTSPDLNQIPAGLIKRIEVLTGGASAVYGSDAVAGVVNFIMNDRFEGVQIDLNHSFYNHRQQNPAGVADIVAARARTNPSQFVVPGDKSADGKETNLSVLLGGNFAGDKGNATLFINYKKTDALLQSERDFSACSLAAGPAGFSCGGSGTNATGRIGVGVGFNTLWTNADAQGTPRRFNNALDQYNFGPTNYFQRPSERYGFNAFANYQVAEKANLYTELSFHDDSTVAQIAPGGAFIDLYTTTFDNPLLSDAWKAALGLTAPGQSVDFTMGRRNVEGGGRQSNFRNTSFRTLVGVKGEVGKWSYDAYAISARVIYSQNEDNYFLAPRIRRAMDVVNVNGVATCQSVVDGSDPSCVPYNIWRLGGVTPAQLAYLQAPGLRRGSTSLEMQGATIATDLGEYGLKFPGAREGVGIVFGAEHRKEALELRTDAATQSGELSGSGGPTPGLNGGFSVDEFFTEVRIPILDGKPLAEQLSVNGSYRRSSYNTDISTNTYGIGVEWAPVKSAKLRASFQSAARAPNLIELFTAQGASLFDLNADPCSTPAATPTNPNPTPPATLAECQRTGLPAALYGTDLDSPAGQYNFLQGGNRNLKPEESDSVTFGIVLQPSRDMSISIDYFDIKVENTIGTVSPETTLRQCLSTGNPAFCSLITRDRAGTLWLLPESQIVAINQNIGGTSTKGFDIGFSYGMTLGGMGRLGISAQGTKLSSLVVEEIKGLGSYDCAGLYGLNKCGAPSPEWRHKVRASWTTPWDVDLAFTWRYLAKVEIQESSNQPLLAGAFEPVNKTLAAQNYLDLAGSWRATKALTLGFGINNVLDKSPPIVVVGTGQGNGNTFPGVYDALGRKIFLNGTYKF
jgi:outer membrane receptor protein involved in Fe transport